MITTSLPLRKPGSERLSDMPAVTQPVRVPAGTGIQMYLAEGLVLSALMLSCPVTWRDCLRPCPQGKVEGIHSQFT